MLLTLWLLSRRQVGRSCAAAQQVIDGEAADDQDVQRQHGDEDRHQFKAAGLLRLEVAVVVVPWCSLFRLWWLGVGL